MVDEIKLAMSTLIRPITTAKHLHTIEHLFNSFNVTCFYRIKICRVLEDCMTRQAKQFYTSTCRHQQDYFPNLCSYPDYLSLNFFPHHKVPTSSAVVCFLGELPRENNKKIYKILKQSLASLNININISQYEIQTDHFD